MIRIAFLFLVASLVSAIAVPASADRREDRAALLDLTDRACSLGLAVDEALATAPGHVVKARLKRSQKPGKSAIRFYRVVSRDTEITGPGIFAAYRVQRFLARSCDPISPVTPVIEMPEAIEAALAELGGGFLVSANLRFPGLEPVYRIVALRWGSAHRRVVLIDGVTGEVLESRRWSRRLDADQDASDEEDDSSM